MLPKSYPNISIPILQSVIQKFSNYRIAVLGDLMLDVYWQGPSHRLSPEAPVPVVELQETRQELGGAGNVAKNLARLGAEVTLFGVTGDDEPGEQIRHACSIAGIKAENVFIDPERPTTQKIRIIANQQQMVRIDREQIHPVSSKLVQMILENTLQSTFDALIISDYHKGLFANLDQNPTWAKFQPLLSQVYVDCKPPNAPIFTGARILKPNLTEAERLFELFQIQAPSFDGQIIGLAHRLDLQQIWVSRGSAGISGWERDCLEVYHLPAFRKEVFDVTGAGDTVLALSALGDLAGLPLLENLFLANVGGSIQVQHPGCYALSPADLQGALPAFSIPSA